MFARHQHGFILILLVLATCYFGLRITDAFTEAVVGLDSSLTLGISGSVEGVTHVIEISEGEPRPATASTLRLRYGGGLQYKPRLITICVGDSVEFRNKWKAKVNVFSYSKALKFDVGRFKPDESRTVGPFPTEGLVRLYDEIHSHMKGFINVVDCSLKGREQSLTDGQKEMRASLENAGEYVGDDNRTEDSSNRTGASNDGIHASMRSASGLQIVTFDTAYGQVRVNLPDDMMAGDTISGTVVAEPKGQNDAERMENMGELSGLVIDITPPKKADGTQQPNVRATVSAQPVPITVVLPLPPASTVNPSAETMVIRLTNTSRLSVGGETIPIEIVSLHLQSVAPIQVQVPTIGQQGKPIEIIGPFDGNLTDTKLMYGPKGTQIQDFEKNTENVSGGFGLIRPLAESPRKVVCESPRNVTGSVEVMVKEGNATTTGPYRNVGVNLSAPKTNLLKGERTTLTIQVSGLQGIAKPVPLTLESHGVITMEGGVYQPLLIQPSQVSADGRYSTTRGITGVQAGAWEATATVVTLPPLILLRDPSPPSHLVINSRTGQYVFCGTERLTGTSEVKADGCTFYFFDDSSEKVLMGVLNACELNTKRYWVFAAGLLPSVTVDLRIKIDSVNPPRTRVYFNPLNRPAPPVQDVSAFATCP